MTNELSIRDKIKQDSALYEREFYEDYGREDNDVLQDYGRNHIQKRIRDKQKPVGEKIADGAAAVASDVATGVSQAPRSMARGAAKGVNSMAGFVKSIGELAPAITLFNEEGEFSTPSITSGKELNKRLTKRAKNKGKDIDFTKADIVPVIDKPKNESVTGNLIEGITQFAVGLKGVDKIGKAAGVAKGAGGLAGQIAKGGLADILAFDEHEARISNVVQGTPLANPVTEYLQAEDDDGFLEGKLKQGIEGMTLGAAGDVLFAGVKFIKNGRKAAVEAGEEGIEKGLMHLSDEVAGGVELDRAKLGILGDADSDEFLLKTVKKTQGKKTGKVKGKITKALRETEDVDGIAGRLVDEPEIKINYARINGAEDVPALMEQMANDPDLIASVKTARRGVQSDEALLKAADDVDGFADLMNRRNGEAFNPEQVIAARKVYYDTTEKLMEAAEKASKADASDIDQFAFRKMMAIHHAVQQEVLGVRAEAARALRAWSVPVEGGGMGVKQIEDVLQGFGGGDVSKDLARRLTAINKSGGKLTTSQINEVTRRGALSRTGKALTEAWTLGLLTSPRTHIVNVTSNMLTGLTLGIEKFTSAGLSQSEITVREALEYYIGYFGSMKQALANSAEAWKTGQMGIGMGKIDLPPVRATSRDMLDPNGKAGIFSKMFDWYGAALNRYAGGALAAGDEFSKTILYQGQLRAMASREAHMLGLVGQEVKEHIAKVISQPPPNLRADAIEFANFGTYTQALTGNLQGLQKIQRLPAARLVMPFLRTPVNIFKFTFERTPLGLLSEKMRADIGAGGARQAQALSKLATGTGIMFAGYDMALNGQITGAGPSDHRTRSALRRAGWQPYSIKIGDEYYSYARFDPFATWLGMASDIAEITTNYEAYDIQAQEEVDELVTAAVAAMANQVVGKTFLSGVADLTQVLADSKRYGPQYLKRYAGSIVPSVVKDIERAVSPETEQVFNKIDAIKSRIPGLSDSVPKRMNVYGEKIQNYYPSEENAMLAMGERAMQIFNPVYYTDKPDSKLDEWFLSNGITPPNMPQKTQSFPVDRFTKDRVTVDLREFPNIYERFMEMRGEVRIPAFHDMTLKEYLGALVDYKVPDSNTFFNAFATDKDAQESHIATIVQTYDQEIRSRLVEEYSVLRQAITQERTKTENTNANRGGQGLIRTKQIP